MAYAAAFVVSLIGVGNGATDGGCNRKVLKVSEIHMQIEIKLNTLSKIHQLLCP